MQMQKIISWNWKQIFFFASEGGCDFTEGNPQPTLKGN